MPALATPPSGVSKRVSGSKECRFWERFPCNLETSCQPVAARHDGDPTWSATIQDVSAGGVGLVVTRRFERGTGLSIEVPASGDEPSNVLLARVAHVGALPDRKWLLGCTLISELSDDELQRLLTMARSAPAAPPEPAPTAKPRQGQIIREVSFRNADAFAAGSTHFVRQLLFKGAWPIPAGTRLKVQVKGQDGTFRPTQLVVQNCVQQEGRWIVTYTFVSQPSLDVRRSLGISSSEPCLTRPVSAGATAPHA